ncbi:MAG: hypothetical protein WKF97_01755 [Chitinophagaceae bacterium]
MDRPFDQFRDIFRKSNEQDIELLKYVFEKSDNISLWIIGLAIGGISIFANNIGDITKVIAPHFLKPILLLLAISVSSGIIYRGLYLYFFVILNHNLRGIDISFSREKTMDTESLLDGNESFEKTINAIRSGFEEDQSHLIPLYYQANDEGRKKLHQDMVTHYNRLVAFAQKDTELAIDFIADTYSKFTGTKKEKYLKSFQGENSAKQYKWTLWTTVSFYFIYLLSFIIALFLFVFAT